MLFGLLGALTSLARGSTAERVREVSAAVRATDLPLPAPKAPQALVAAVAHAILDAPGAVRSTIT